METVKTIRFPRWKIGVIFAVIQWLVICLIALITKEETVTVPYLLYALYAVIGGILYILLSWFFGDKTKNIQVDIKAESEQEKGETK